MKKRCCGGRMSYVRRTYRRHYWGSILDVKEGTDFVTLIDKDK